VPGALEHVQVEGLDGLNVAQLLQEGSVAMQVLQRGPE
jgi:hypothetical protein